MLSKHSLYAHSYALCIFSARVFVDDLLPYTFSAHNLCKRAVLQSMDYTLQSMDCTLQSMDYTLQSSILTLHSVVIHMQMSCSTAYGLHTTEHGLVFYILQSMDCTLQSSILTLHSVVIHNYANEL